VLTQCQKSLSLQLAHVAALTDANLLATLAVAFSFQESEAAGLATFPYRSVIAPNQSPW
jgi:hypothetical protein